MGREASCRVHWGTESKYCKVLLESSELIVRGPLPRRAALAAIHEVTVDGDKLTFLVDDEPVALDLGSEQAARWSKAIAKPPPTLAKKLGLSSATHVALAGSVSDLNLKAAVSAATTVDGPKPDVVIAEVHNAEELETVISGLSDAPAWLVYPKSIKKFSESHIRKTMRAAGYIDTKVASVSTAMTGLRFQKRPG